MSQELNPRREMTEADWDEAIRQSREAAKHPEMQAIFAEMGRPEDPWTREIQEWERVYRATQKLRLALRCAAENGDKVAQKICELPFEEMVLELARAIHDVDADRAKEGLPPVEF